MPACASTWAIPLPIVPAPTTTALLGGFNGDRERLTATEASGGDTSLATAPLQLMQHGRHEAGTAAAEWVAECNRATIDVDAVAVPPEQLAVRDELRGEGLIDF